MVRQLATRAATLFFLMKICYATFKRIPLQTKMRNNLKLLKLCNFEPEEEFLLILAWIERDLTLL